MRPWIADYYSGPLESAATLDMFVNRMGQSNVDSRHELTETRQEAVQQVP